MRLFRFGDPARERPGAIDGDGVARDISSILGDLAGDALSPASLAALRTIDLTRFPAVDDGVRRGPCVTGVGNFIAVGLNYAVHAAETGAQIPAEPVLFNKAPSCIVGPNDDIKLPRGASKTDWEVELAVIIGKHASCIAEADAHSVIAGYCVCDDVSERSFQLERGGQWTKGKGCPTFGPLGPWLVTPDEIEDVQKLTLWLDVNGQRMQSGSTSSMIFGVHYLVAYISQFMALQPGDVIATGTPPGVALGMKNPRYLTAGDVVSLGIERLGAQQHRVVAG
jgi:2,4-diketo-3-deoxy-L-fuconate hydrolase